MKNALNILFLISICCMPFANAQQIKQFFINACTFYYQDSPIQYKVDGVYCSVKGILSAQQDTLLVNDQVISKQDPDLEIQEFSFQLSEPLLFGVFDGHGSTYDNGDDNGFEASHYVADQFKKLFAQYSNKDVEMLFKEIDKDVLKQEFAQDAGTTACVCKVDTDGSMCVYNLGDSRALWGVGKDQATRDHSVKNDEECKRVESLCTISRDHFCCMGKSLAVSRAFGDNYMRNVDGQKNNIVISIPEKYTPDVPTLFIGCDGCFDYTSNEVIYEIYTKCLNKKRSLIFTAYAILNYICSASPKFKQLNLYRENPFSGFFEKLDIKKEEVHFAEIKKYVLADYKYFLHDNTSFILLNIINNQGNQKSDPYFVPINKERAILLLFISVGLVWKYLHGYK
ncbi:protein phosphatase 2C family protein [Candidatus Dependentiae bacterium]|nr:MAG: protein phosphatase 2C family protein [Candidatus Dependentiae bacterium]